MDRWRGVGTVGPYGRFILPADDPNAFEAISGCAELEPWAELATERSNNGGTEAVNGIIELHRRIARGSRDQGNYRLRMILAAGRLAHSQLR